MKIRRVEATSEIAIGQLIQNQVQQQELLERNSRTLSTLQRDVDSLITHTELPPRAKGKRKRSR